MSATHVSTSPLTKERWEDVIALFGTRGDPSWCWCQFFHDTGHAPRRTADQNRADLHSQVTTGATPPGLLAYAGDEPVGWVQVGPRTAYRRLCESRALAEVTGDDLHDDQVWAVTCFVVKVGRRRLGISTRLLAAAVEFAAGHGARVLEGHPVDVAARPSGRAPGAELYHGVATTFAAAGFTEVGRTSPARPVMRLSL
ncbi:MAG TPA: GNAT family N-acetyltransferase [Pedococcus sp.]|nr:GNAT family N-acetyltransferase [Pedococcus sp.]